MNKEDVEKYSIIQPDPEFKNNLMSFGFMCGYGWFPIIYELLDKIQAIVDKTPELKDIQVTEIKEKYGGLRFYINYGTDEIFDIIDEYEKKSFTVCERCGDPGKLRKNDYRWYKTLCDNCYDKWINHTGEF
jgi:hypothetical protein